MDFNFITENDKDNLIRIEKELDTENSKGN